MTDKPPNVSNPLSKDWTPPKALPDFRSRMTGHDKAHYVIGIAALLIAAAAFVMFRNESGEVHKLTLRKPVTVVQQQPGFGGFAEAAPKPRPAAWPGLGQDKTIAMGEALQALAPARAVVFCAGANCRDLEADIDDAFQIAGWDDDEAGPAMIGDDEGLLVGPPGTKTDAVVKALSAAGLAPVKVVPMNVGTRDIGIIIARRPRPTSAK